jgi:hypothetical protein
VAEIVDRDRSDGAGYVAEYSHQVGSAEVAQHDGAVET